MDQRSARLKYRKARNFATGEGERYEESSLVLAFLRCVRNKLHFLLSSNDAAGGKFDDLVLCWKHLQAVSALFVQLKHKTSAKQTTIRRNDLMYEKGNDFSLNVYRESYAKVRSDLDGGSYGLVLVTNLDLHKNAQPMFVRRDLESVPGANLLDSGDCLYSLNPEDADVKKVLKGDELFIRDFYLFCKQGNNATIKEKICAEIKEVLGADEGYCKAASENLCRSIRSWMNAEEVCLTGSWEGWLKIVDTYVREEVSMCNSVVTRIKYINVEALQAYIEGHNPAWIRAPGREVTALTATKVHQIICGEKHIMASVTRLSELEEKVLSCWGPFCRWLIILDDEDDDHSCDILYRLGQLAGPKRRLVILSHNRCDSFLDTCKSDDFHKDSWSEVIDATIRLNDDQHVCHLRDLCGTGGLRAMLDGNPEAVAALSQLSGPVRMGQGLDALPENHIDRLLTSRMRVGQEFFSSLGDKDLAIMDEVSCKFLTDKSVMKDTIKFEELENHLSASDTNWPLFATTNKIDSSAVQMLCSKHAGIHVYALSHVDEGRLYVEDQSVTLLQIVNDLDDRVIIEGKLGVGKSTVLLDLARQLKGLDPSWWILRIDLLKYSEVFRSCISGAEVSKRILARAVYNEGNLGVLERSLLQHCLREYPRIICMLDGFDEVCRECADEGECLHLEAVQELAPGRGKLVVTTRTSLTGRLEAALRVPAHSLPEFTDKQLEAFHRKPLSEIGVADKVRDLLKIPLFSRMFDDLLKCKTVRKVHVCDIVTLYNAFFEMNFRRLYEGKCGIDPSIGVIRDMIEGERMKHEEHLQILAVSCLFPGLEVTAPSYSMNKNDLGFIYQYTDGKPIFIHRTYAEHYLAKWCFSKAADSLCAYVHRKAQSDSSLEFFVESFDRMASNDRPLLMSVLNHRESQVKSLLQNGANAAEGDKWGRNSLHVAASYSHDSALIGLLVERLEVTGGLTSGIAEETRGAVAAEAVFEGGVASDSWLVEASEPARTAGAEEMVRAVGSPQHVDAVEAVTMALAAEDDLLQWTPLRYAAERRRWTAVAALLEAGAQLSHLGDFQRGLHNPQELWRVFKEGGYTFLFYHVVDKIESAWRLKMMGQGGENQRCLQIQVGLSIVCAQMSLEQYTEILSEADVNGNYLVVKLLLLKTMDMMKTSGSPALYLCQISSESSQLQECRQTPLAEAGLGSSSVQRMATEGDGVMLRNAAGETSLHDAVRRGDVERVQQLIECGADVNLQNCWGHSAIHLAVFTDNVDCIKRLQSVGADVNSKDNCGQCPLHGAAALGRTRRLKMLLGAGADLLAQDSMHLTPLHKAANAGNVACARLLASAANDLELKTLDGRTALHFATKGEAECVESLLCAGADSSPVSGTLDTPMHLAALKGNTECVRLLLQAGADVAPRNSRGSTALHCAAGGGTPGCVRLLLKTGAGVQKRNDCGATPLHYAAERGCSQSVKLLLDAGADPLAQNSRRRTPLHEATNWCHAECVRWLASSASNLEVKDLRGFTALHWAAINFDAECVKLLLAAGAHSSAVTSSLDTPLHLAAHRGSAECVRLLVQAGADVTARNARDLTALHFAVKIGNPECVRHLLEAGAGVHQKDGYGDTPLHLAVLGGSPACIRLLLEKGADVDARNNNAATPLHCAVRLGKAKCAKLLLGAGADPLTLE